MQHPGHRAGAAQGGGTVRLAFVAPLVAFGLTLVAPGGAAADEVRLENGDVLRGKVTGATEKSLTLKHVFGDEVILPLDKIASIETDEPALVRLSDGSQVRGRLRRGPAPGTMTIDSRDAGTVTAVPFANVRGLGDLPPDGIWSGRIAVGISVLDGNTQGKSAFASFDAERRSKQDLIEAHANYVYAETFGEVTTRKSFARGQYNYYVHHPLYLYVGAALEYDRFRNLNLRSRGGAGAGYAWVDRPTLSLRTEAGVEYVNEDLRDAEDRDFVSVRAALTFDWQATDWLKLREFAEIFPSAENFEEFVSRSETSVTFALWKGFGLAGVLIWDHVSRPPPGREKNDEQYLLTLTYTF